MPRSNNGGTGLPPHRPLPSPLLAALPLAHGELSDSDAAELALLKTQIEEHGGVPVRRLQGEVPAAQDCGAHASAGRAHVRRLRAHAGGGLPPSTSRLVDALTVNVSKFFRNPEVWEVISSGCCRSCMRAGSRSARGAQAVPRARRRTACRSCAHEHTRLTGTGTDRLQVLGTDVDRGILAAAQRVPSTATFAMTDIDPALRDRWFDADGLYRLRPAAQQGVRSTTTT
jgi:hypothetical protein